MKLEELEVDARGFVVPTKAALTKVERDYPHETAAEKRRLAQAQTMIDAYNEDKAGPPEP